MLSSVEEMALFYGLLMRLSVLELMLSRSVLVLYQLEQVMIFLEVLDGEVLLLILQSKTYESSENWYKSGWEQANKTLICGMSISQHIREGTLHLHQAMSRNKLLIERLKCLGHSVTI